MNIRIRFGYQEPVKSLIICEFFIFHLPFYLKADELKLHSLLYQNNIATTILKTAGARKK